MAKKPTETPSKKPSRRSTDNVPSMDVRDEYIHPLSRKFLWLGEQKVIDGFIWVPIIGLIISTMAVFIYPFDDAHKASWDFFASWAIIGLVAYSIVVISAEPLFRLLSRKENYYGEEVEPEIIVAPKVEVHHHD